MIFILFLKQSLKMSQLIETLSAYSLVYVNNVKVVLQRQYIIVNKT